MIMRAALYACTSNSTQTRHALSIPDQLAEMKRFAAARHWQITDEFIDIDTSRDRERPGLQAALAAAAKRSFDVLIAPKLSCLSPSVFDTLEILEQLGQHGIGFASVQEPQFDFSASARSFLTTLSALDEYYLDLSRESIARARRRPVREGLYSAGVLPYGYRRAADPKLPPIVDPEAARAVRMAFELYAGGNASFEDVAAALNAKGFKTASGRQFTGAIVDMILRNRFYTGLVVYGPRKKGQPSKVFPGQHEPIISTELFEQVKEMRQQRYFGSRSLPSHQRVYLLNGIVYCDACGRRLRAQTTPTGSYYRETSNARGYLDCPDARRGARADLVEAQLGALFRDLRLPDDWIERVQELLPEDRSKATARGQDNRRERLEAKLRRLRQLYEAGYYDDDLDAFEREAQAIQRKIDELPLPQDLATIEEAAATLSTLAEVWEEATPAERRDLVRLAVAEVFVDVNQSRVTRLRPHTPFRPLFQQLSSLAEIEPGRFSPLFSPDVTAALGVEPILPALTIENLPAEAPLWPLVMTVPPGTTGNRVTPVLSRALKDQHQAGIQPQHIVDVPHAGFPPLKTDPHNWPDVAVKTYAWRGDSPPKLRLPNGSVTFLHTPFAYQMSEHKAAWIDEAERLLAVGGRWYLLDIMPEHMPGHWLFRFFPKAGDMIRATAQRLSTLYLALQERGWSVTLKRQTYYQAVSAQAALEIAQDRSRSIWLTHLVDGDYQEGLKRLKETVAKQRKEMLLPSRICLAEGVVERKA